MKKFISITLSFFIILTPIISLATITVKGLVIPLAKPNPVATIQTRNPVNPSKPKEIQIITIIGNNVKTSSNRPKREPNNIKISVITAISNLDLFLNLLINLFTITFIPLVSLII